MTPIECARAKWESDTVPYPLSHRSGKREVPDEFRRFGDAIAILEWTHHCGVLKIEPIKPCTGGPSALLEYLRNLADTYNITLFGNVIAYSPSRLELHARTLTQEELEAWYIRHGFEIHRGGRVVELWYPASPYIAQQ